MAISRTSWLRLLSATAVIASGGCGDSTTAPTGNGPVTVSVSVLAVGPAQLSSTPEGIALATCLVDLKGAVRTHGNAAWGTAVFRFYPGRDLTQPVDTAVVPNTLVVQSWGAGGISDLNPVFASWLFTASIPFTVELEYRYQVGSNPVQTTEPVTAFCSPPIPANPAPVSITNLVTTPAAGSVQPGDTVSVTYTVAAPAGLWQTVILLSGGCDTLRYEPEFLAQSPTRTARVVVPPRCQLGAPLNVTVSVLDAALNQDNQSIPVPFTLVDLRPPAVAVSLSSDVGVFVGEGLTLDFLATDNNALSTVVWELVPFGLRDSILSSFPALASQASIPILPGWTGPFDVRVIARDAAGVESTIVASPPGGLTSFPTRTVPTVQVLTTNQQLDRLVFDPRRGVLYSLQQNRPKIMVLSATTLQFLDSIPLPTDGADLDLSPSGDTLLVTLPAAGTLGVIDLSQPVRQVGSIVLAGLDPSQGQSPQHIRALAGDRALVTIWGAPTIEVDLAGGSQLTHPTIAVALERSPDYQVAMLRDQAGGIRRFDIGTGLGPQVPFPAPGSITLDTGGQRLGLSLNLFDGNGVKLGSPQTLRYLGVTPSLLSPDGQYLYYLDDVSGLVRTRTSDLSIVDRIPLPQAVLHGSWMGISPDGRWVVLLRGASIVMLDLS